MPLQILVPFDNSEPAREALEYAFELFSDAEITVLTVVDLSDVHHTPEALGELFTEEEAEGVRAEVKDQLEAAEEFSEEHGITIQTATRVGAPSKVIVEYAQTEDVDHIVMGSHGRSGVTRILLGSVAEVVVRRSPVPVTVVR